MRRAVTERRERRGEGRDGATTTGWGGEGRDLIAARFTTSETVMSAIEQLGGVIKIEKKNIKRVDEIVFNCRRLLNAADKPREVTTFGLAEVAALQV